MLVTASTDHSITTYNCETGKKGETNYSKKYGVDNITYTHSDSCILYSSTITSKDMNEKALVNAHSLRYQSLHDNKYIRYLRGHIGLVRSLREDD